jgi:hypothetical protein
MHTKDKLATALRDVGLNEMADKAATGWYDDYLSPLDMPIVTLVNDLAVAAARPTEIAPEKIMKLRKRAMEGDFDATAEESDAWAASPEFQEAFARLLGPKR